MILSSFASSINKIPERIDILNIGINNISRDDLFRDLKKGIVLTPNISHLALLQKDSYFYNIYQQADYILCDSQILLFILKLLGTPIKEKISGADLLPEFCMYNINNDTRVFLLGSASSETVELAKKKINGRSGRNVIVDCYSPSFGFELNQEENDYIIRRIIGSRANVVAVGVGAPKQEKWIIDHKNKLPSVNLFMAIGAAIDFESGAKKRAPLWMRSAGFEWCHRLIEEPGRLWRRYLIDGFRVFIEIFRFRLGLYKNPWR